MDGEGSEGDSGSDPYRTCCYRAAIVCLSVGARNKPPSRYRMRLHRPRPKLFAVEPSLYAATPVFVLCSTLNEDSETLKFLPEPLSSVKPNACVNRRQNVLVSNMIWLRLIDEHPSHDPLRTCCEHRLVGAFLIVDRTLHSPSGLIKHLRFAKSHLRVADS